MSKLKIAVLLLFISKLGFAQVSDARLDGLDLEVESLLKAYHAVGLSVAIVENNKTVYAKGYGFRDLDKKLPVTANTVFPIGSITKSFTASLLGMLADQHKISLQDKPSLHIPKLQFYDDRMDNLISIEDLLCHKSGIGGVDGSYILFPADKREDLMPRLKHLKPNGAINNSWRYSNMGYIIAGSIVEKTTGFSWDKNIHDKIFSPLNMVSSSTSIADMVKGNNYSLGYGLHGTQVKKVLFEELHNNKPGGAINSSITDMANWITTWLNNGTFHSKVIFSNDYSGNAMSIKAIDNGLPPEKSDPGVYTFGYGYGWKVNSSNGHYKVHHGGNVSGFSSQLALYPTDNLGIVVLTNQNNSILPYIIADIVANRMLKKPRTEWNKYPVKHSQVYQVSTAIKDINTEKKTTHHLTAYCGNFYHPGYGRFEIVHENNNLYAVFPGYKLRLEHQYYDIFVLKAIKEIPQHMNPEFYLNFSLDFDGNIASVKINLQNEPVEFIKEKL